MKVLEIIPTLDQGGAEKQLCLLAAGLKQRGVDIQVCALTRGGPRAEQLRQADVPLHLIHKRWKLDIGAYRRLRKLVGELRPDVVHTWLFAANAYGRKAAFAHRVPVVIAGERCVDPWKSWEFSVDRWLAKRTSCIAANSSGIQEFYVEHGLPREKFRVIPNAIDVDRLARDAQDLTAARQNIRAELGIGQEQRVILAVGRLWPQKRYKDLIWAADLLKVIRDDVHLLIAGDGPQRWRLERFRRQVQIEDRVHLLGERKDVPQLMAAADCYWLGSGYEGQSNSLMEAMATGLPVVVSDIPGNRDLVEHQKSGMIVPVGSREEFARQTNVLLNDPDQAARLGAAARQRMATDFSLDKMVERHYALYEELLAAAQRGSAGGGG